jgi:fructokinase
MTDRLTCIGEALIDFLPIGEGGHTAGFSMHPGGAPLNVAVGLARLGQPVAFVGKVSTDFFGRYLRSYLAAEAVETRFLASDAAPSTLAFVAIEAGEPVFTFYGEGTADAALAADEVPEQCLAETRILHFGSISLLRGTTPAAVLATAERLKGRALLSFDPNLRPGLIYDESAFRALLRRLFGLADLVKLSAADSAWLMPDQPIEQVACGLLALGPALVVVTHGAEGLLAVRPSTRGAAEEEDAALDEEIRCHHLPAFQVEVVDTVGAGDTFSAGLLAELAQRGATSRRALEHMAAADLDATLRFAMAASALACTRAGADPPRRAEVEQFLARRAY